MRSPLLVPVRRAQKILDIIYMHVASQKRSRGIYLYLKSGCSVNTIIKLRDALPLWLRTFLGCSFLIAVVRMAKEAIGLGVGGRWRKRQKKEGDPYVGRTGVQKKQLGGRGMGSDRIGNGGTYLPTARCVYTPARVRIITYSITHIEVATIICCLWRLCPVQ
jgi:hypothetical protein